MGWRIHLDKLIDINNKILLFYYKMDSYIIDNYPIIDIIIFKENNKNVVDKFYNKIKYLSEFKENGLQHIINFNKQKFIVAFISAKIDEFFNVYIKYLDVNIKYQNNGYGTFLITELSKYCKNTYKSINIYADDTTERDGPHNIFYKLGFFVNDYKFNEKGQYINSLVKWNKNIGADIDEHRIINIDELLNIN